MGVLFEKLASAAGPRVLPKVNTAGFKGEPGAGSEGPLKANPTPSETWPKGSHVMFRQPGTGIITSMLTLEYE